MMKVTKQHVHILLLTVSGHELFERPSYIRQNKLLQHMNYCMQSQFCTLQGAISVTMSAQLCKCSILFSVLDHC